MAVKIIHRGKQAREKLKRGIDLAADLIGATMGPWGRVIAIEWIGKWPHFTDDGSTVAGKIEVEDETENIGVMTIADAAKKTDYGAGDGTTTAAVLTRAIISDVFKKLDTETHIIGGNPFNVVQAYKDIKFWAGKVIEEIDKEKKNIETKEDLDRVCIISAKSEELGMKVSDMMWRMGKNGHITIEDSTIPGIDAQVVDGLHFYGKPAADFMFDEKQEAKLSNVPVFVTNDKVEGLPQFFRSNKPDDMCFNDFIKGGQKEMVVIAPDFGKDFMDECLGNWNLRRIRILAIKVKSLTPEQIEDIAVYTGANFIDSRRGHKFSQSTQSDWGTITQIKYSRDRVSIIGGGGTKEVVERRVEDIKNLLKKEDDDLFQKKYERRISALSGGVGIIRVGGSEIEKIYIIKKLEDAKNSARLAMEDGIIRGGGIVLKEIAERFEENILTNALKSPYEQIQTNAGGFLEIGEDVFDAAKVTKEAVKNACDTAATFIMVGGSIATKRRDLFDDMLDNMREDERFKSLLPSRDRDKEQDSWREKAANY